MPSGHGTAVTGARLGRRIGLKCAWMGCYNVWHRREASVMPTSFEIVEMPGASCYVAPPDRQGKALVTLSGDTQKGISCKGQQSGRGHVQCRDMKPDGIYVLLAEGRDGTRQKAPVTADAVPAVFSQTDIRMQPSGPGRAKARNRLARAQPGSAVPAN